MEQYDKIIFDFDDTIWSRDPKDIDCSIYNIKFIKENLGDKAIIISGNSYNSIESKLEAVDISMPHIWADANSILYENGEPKRVIHGCDISESVEKFLSKYRYDIEPQLIGSLGYITNVKFRPITHDRDLICEKINSTLKFLKCDDCIAKTTGKSTIDIVSIYNSKILVYNYLELDKYKTLYIGDEIDSGNDKDISELCTRRLRVNSVYETKTILDCFGGKL